MTSAGAGTSPGFVLRGDHITLDALLKASGIVASGGEAKALIAGGAVQVNGQAESRRGRKLRAGDEVAVGTTRLRLRPAGEGSGLDDEHLN